MAAASAAPLETEALAPGEVLRIWLKHLTSFYLPGVSLAFVLTGPHPWWIAIAFMLPMVFAHHVDCAARAERRQPSRSVPAWPFDALVYALTALQLWIVFELVRMFSAGQQGVFSVDMIMAFVLVGGSSGFSIITAHELIHRPRKWEQNLGRLLLSVVMYEHFYTEHLRGHHVRVGTADDPATARFGERFEPFFRRTVPAQFRSAWRLETQRLGDVDMSLFDRRQLENRVLHGLAFEWALAFAVLAAFGVAGFVAFLLQAFMAVRLLEAVNYFEHWGLQRRGKRVAPIDSWDTHGWFTYYGLVGLSRHADHHAYPIRPYQKLRVWEEAPVLPYGYVGTVDLVMANNDEFMRVATEELGRRRLGPFVPAEGEAPSAMEADEALGQLADATRAEDTRAGADRPPAGPIAWLRALAAFLSTPARRVGAVLAVAIVSAGLVHWETGAADMAYGARVLLHLWIFASLAGMVFVAHQLKARTDHESFAWSVGMAVLAVLGTASTWLLG